MELSNPNVLVLIMVSLLLLQLFFSKASKELKWRGHVCEKVTTLTENGTWILVDPHPSQNVVGYKWVFKIYIFLKRHMER